MGQSPLGADSPPVLQQFGAGEIGMRFAPVVKLHTGAFVSLLAGGDRRYGPAMANPIQQGLKPVEFEIVSTGKYARNG